MHSFLYAWACVGAIDGMQCLNGVVQKVDDMHCTDVHATYGVVASCGVTM